MLALRLLVAVSERVRVIAATLQDHIADFAQAVIPAEGLELITLQRSDPAAARGQSCRCAVMPRAGDTEPSSSGQAATQ